MNYEKEINFLKNTLIEQNHIIMELQNMILGHNAFLSESLFKIEEKLKEAESEDYEEASDESPGHLLSDLKTPMQEKRDKSDMMTRDGVLYA